MKAFYTILLLIVSNIFMTFAWYGHLKLQEMKVISKFPIGRSTPSSSSHGPLPWPSIPFRCPPTASASSRTVAPSR